MADPIPGSIKKIWDEWNIRGMILLSLSLQIVLVFSSPLRKGTGNRLIIMLIWSAYLLADWAANFAVGLISDSQGDPPSDSTPDNNDLLAFWPPFLMLHLGGPDTITAFALEDNELWLRHMLGLVFQLVAAIYVFLRTFPGNSLMVPTILMMFAGLFKYCERTRALYLASIDQFRDSMLGKPDPGPNYAKLMDEYASKKGAKLPTKIVMIAEPDEESKAATNPVRKGYLDEFEVVYYAYKYFNTFKGLLVDLIYSFRERKEVQDFFNERTSEDAFKVIATELNFIYEVFYTKFKVVHSMIGSLFRFASSSLLVTSLCLFHIKVKKDGFDEIDVIITYILFWGAIGLDFIGLVMLVFSDWTFAAIGDPDNYSDSERKDIIGRIKRWVLILEWPSSVILSNRKPRWKICDSKQLKHNILATRFLFRRWSGSVPGYNLVRLCLKKSPIQIYKTESWFRQAINKVSNYLKSNRVFKAISSILIDPVQKTFKFTASNIFHQLHLNEAKILMRDRIINPLASIFSKVIAFPVRWGGKIIAFFRFFGGKITGGIKKLIDWLGLTELYEEAMYASSEPITKELWNFIFEELKEKAQYADDPETVERISSSRGDWILRDPDLKIDHSRLLPYVTDVPYDESLLQWHIATELLYHTEVDEIPIKSQEKREFSKILSDYMLYLLIMQPSMMSAVAGIGKIRFRDTRAEVERFIKRGGKKGEIQHEDDACIKILEVETRVIPVAVKGDKSKSVLFDASMLAKELRKVMKDDVWNVISKVWVELMSYAASECSAITHAELVSSGGELLSFVWLSMAHFGLGRQFQIKEGIARAKLIVGK